MGLIPGQGLKGLLWWLSRYRTHLQCRRRRKHEFDSWVGEDPLEQDMTNHSSVFSGKILWTEEPGGLQSMGLQRDGHDWSDRVCSTGNSDPTCCIVQSKKKKLFLLLSQHPRQGNLSTRQSGKLPKVRWFKVVETGFALRLPHCGPCALLYCPQALLPLHSWCLHPKR